MAERMTGLSIDHLFEGNHNHPRIPKFLEDFSRSLYAGEGKKPAALQSLGVEPDFPLRLLLGIPAKELTRTQRLLAEAYCAMFFGRNLGDTKGLWTGRPGWRPTNPGRQPAPLDNSVLDSYWMTQLGISRFIWEGTVLASTGAVANPNQAKPDAVIRHLLMLSVFGFSDPYQFFTRRPDEE